MVTLMTLLEASQVLVPAPLLKDSYPVPINTLHRLEITAEDSITMLRMKVADYSEKTDAEILHLINRYFNGFKGENSNDKGLTILPLGTYLVDIVDHLRWNAGDFGDQHSCYWQGYINERRRMGQEGTWALRIHFSPKSRNYNVETVEEKVEAIQAAYPDMLRERDGNGYPLDFSNDGARAFFVPWWRLAERPGAAREGQNDQEPRGRWRNRGLNQRIVPATNEPGWQQAFGGRWTGDRRTAIMHNAYGSLHLPQLAGLYAKMTGLFPNDLSAGITTFGDAQPYEYDWIFDRNDYMYNRHRITRNAICEKCGTDVTYSAARPMKIRRTNMDGEPYGPANINGMWCMDCVITHAKRSPKSDNWTRTKGVKWNA